MQLLRESAIGILNGTSPNYDAAREVIGQYLHMLQMFYSNTNWVEMSGNKIHETLGMSFWPPKDYFTCAVNFLAIFLAPKSNNRWQFVNKG